MIIVRELCTQVTIVNGIKVRIIQFMLVVLKIGEYGLSVVERKGRVRLRPDKRI